MSTGVARAVPVSAFALSCPFCGRGEALTLAMRYRNRHLVICSARFDGCGAAGPSGSTPDEARAKWNRRRAS